MTQGVDGGPGLSGLVVQTNTSLGLLFPSVFDAMSCRWERRGQNGGLKCVRREKIRQDRTWRKDGMEGEKMERKLKKKKRGTVRGGVMREGNTRRNLSRSKGTVLINRSHYSLWSRCLLCLHFSSIYSLHYPHPADNQFALFPQVCTG